MGTEVLLWRRCELTEQLMDWLSPSAYIGGPKLRRECVVGTDARGQWPADSQCHNYTDWCAPGRPNITFADFPKNGAQKSSAFCIVERGVAPAKYPPLASPARLCSFP